MSSLPYIKIIKIGFAGLILVSLFFFIRATNFSETASTLTGVGFGFLWIVGITSLAYWLGTIGWQYCMGDDRRKVSIGQLFMIRTVCETVSIFNPASIIGGDLLKVFLLKPYIDQQETVINSVVISRIMMIITQVFLLLTAFVWLFFSDVNKTGIPIHYVLYLLVFAGAAALAFYGILRICSFKSSESHVIGKMNLLTAAVRNYYNSFIDFYRRKPKAFLGAFLFFSMHWVVGSMEFCIILYFLGYHISVMEGLIMDMGVIVIKSAGAFIPGQLGIEEVGNKMVLGLIGVGSASLWLSVSILRRARLLFWILTGGLFYLLIYKRRQFKLKSNGSFICEP
ncbi:lysylphosphatidylglycerol synthase transmembrane domain-containing protein [Pedobacter metabolipauper]|uniref:Lysylphosphatidylglycerol synthase-like protein n=1 Tax=Pedobacter metabolipauper TaxID=425513 RepID=A0A4V3D1B4_9SPHI|nr:lysylphosphatidylglycerol synthase transmembrane domain-containing protein [Pedobacter metabolipauper]TDQ10017.1 lysylphosphatidylglycerol synthase-like protein [Pedobacter metabolipauper]